MTIARSRPAPSPTHVKISMTASIAWSIGSSSGYGQGPPEKAGLTDGVGSPWTSHADSHRWTPGQISADRSWVTCRELRVPDGTTVGPIGAAVKSLQARKYAPPPHGERHRCPRRGERSRSRRHRTQGGQVARRLLQDGWRVRALTRTPDGEKAAELRRLGRRSSAPTWRIRRRSKAPSPTCTASTVYSCRTPGPWRSRSGRAGTPAVGGAWRGQPPGLRLSRAGRSQAGDRAVGCEDRHRTRIPGAGPPTDSHAPHGMHGTDDRRRAYFPQSSTWYTMPRLLGEDYRVAWISVQDIGAISAKPC